MNKILRYTILVGFFIIPFIPLIIANSFFFPFITGKGFAFRILVELMLGIWAIVAINDRRYRPRMSWIFWPLIAFIIVMALADAHSIYPYKSFWSNYERMEGYITLLHLFAYFIVASTILNTERLWNWFWNTSIGVSIIIIIYGFLQLGGALTINQGGVRLDATFGNATYLAVYALFHIFIIAYIILSDKMFLFIPSLNGFQNKRLKAALGIIVIIFESVILYNTQTRGAMLGLIAGVGLAALLIAIFERQRTFVRKTSIGVIIAAIAIVLIFLAVKNTNFVKHSQTLQRFASISLSDPTTESRFILWHMAWDGFKERPILGWGQESFNYVFNKYYDPRLYNQEQWFDRTHNVFFDWLIAGGILGIATYLWFFISIIWYAWKSDRFSVAEKSIITGLLVAYFIHNLFVFDNLISYILFFSIAAFVHSRITHSEEQFMPVQENRVILPVSIIVTLIIMYVVNYNAIMANTTLISALSPSQTGVADNITKFNKALDYHSFGTPEIREQIFAMADSVATQSTPVPGGADFLNFAIIQAAAQASTTPLDARYQLLGGALMNRMSNYDAAITYLEKAHALSPEKQSIMFELGSSYIGAKQYEKAEALLKYAYELAPAYQDAKLFYAVTAIYAKDNAVASQLLASLPQDVVLASDQILYAYYTVGASDKVLAMWKARSVASPNDPQIHVSLAAAYLLVKDTKDAIAEIRKAEALYPDFKTQGEAYIKQIQSGKIPQ